MVVRSQRVTRLAAGFRSEAPLQRADRNFAELLQELRVLFTGVRILPGFRLLFQGGHKRRLVRVALAAMFVAGIGILWWALPC